jgi:hypothetical protein
MVEAVKAASYFSATSDYVRKTILSALSRDGIVILPPQDVKKTLLLVRRLNLHFDTVMLDPWYNKGFGGTQDDYCPHHAKNWGWEHKIDDARTKLKRLYPKI